MREPNWTTCTEEELWKYVATHLSKNGIDSILVGGAVVAIYTDGVYRSGDLDFVLLTYLNKELPRIMKEIGFEVRKSQHYSHPKCKHLIIDFASGPPGIGEDLRIVPAEVQNEGTTIRLFSPTDCIRDRLASYIHFKAAECLDQAVLVALRHKFNRTKVKKWCANEGAPKAFNDFEEKLRVSKEFKELKDPLKEPLTTRSGNKDSNHRQAHPWRACPNGEHWVRTHPLQIPPSSISPSGSVTTRHEHCAKNPSGKDQLYADEINKIAEQHFGDFKKRPCPLSLKFARGNDFDDLIAGWTQYWNDILQPRDPLEPNLVKALIASESKFDPTVLANKKRSESARGLMQITDATRKILTDEKGEIKDHYVTATREELINPNVNICAGVRWLFHKRALGSKDKKKPILWIRAIYEFKGCSLVSKTDAERIMNIFKKKYEALKKCQK